MYIICRAIKRYHSKPVLHNVMFLSFDADRAFHTGDFLNGKTTLVFSKFFSALLLYFVRTKVLILINHIKSLKVINDFTSASVYFNMDFKCSREYCKQAAYIVGRATFLMLRSKSKTHFVKQEGNTQTQLRF
jgi:hypothetical protein